MPIVTTRAVVLQTYRYSDTSKILRLLTFDHGPQSAIARGALRPRSRMSGLLEPFAEGMATLYLKPNRDLHALSGFDLIRERQALGLDLPRFTGASLLCELVLRIAPREADPVLFEVLVTALDDLLAADGTDVQPVVVASVWHLMSVLGFAPSVEVCVECGREPEPGRPARFDLREGGLRCDRCTAAGRFLPPDEVTALRALVAGRTATGASAAQMALLSEFIRYHAAEGTRIRSLEFLGAVSP